MRSASLLPLLVAIAACSSEAGAPIGSTPPIAPEPPRAAAAHPAPEAPSPTPRAAEPARPFVIVELAPTQGDLLPLLREHVERARARGLKPFAEFYADWCGPCRALDRHLDNPRLVEAFRGTYIAKLNFDDWQLKLDDTGFRPREIPMFYALDAAGRPTGRKLDGGAWRRNVPEAMAPPLAAFFHE